MRLSRCAFFYANLYGSCALNGLRVLGISFGLGLGSLAVAWIVTTMVKVCVQLTESFTNVFLKLFPKQKGYK